MPKKEKESSCCDSGGVGFDRYQVVSIVSVDERGQMVLPKELRSRVGIESGEKLALVVSERGGRACCIHIFKAEELTEIAKSMIGPLAANLKMKS